MRLIDADRIELEPNERNIMNGVYFSRHSGKVLECVKRVLKVMIDNAPTVDPNSLGCTIELYTKMQRMESEIRFCHSLIKLYEEYI